MSGLRLLLSTACQFTIDPVPPLHWQANEGRSAGNIAGVARRVWSDVESNELLLYMRRLEPTMLDSLSRPADGAVDAAFNALVNSLLGSLARLYHSH